MLRDFLKAGFPSQLTDISITRIHMPAPERARASRTQIKPMNKGFAYVDFDSKAALDAALSLSETMITGRRVLIKDAKNFQGRPEKAVVEKSTADSKGLVNGKKPAKRVFVGNLGFDTTKAELREHFDKCGTVADVFMATFEDTGKCKGYAWVTFEEVESARNAVRGWVRVTLAAGGEDDQDEEVGKKDGEEKIEKTRKWFVNKMQGRPLRCEFAEDATVRYKKRYGKEGREAREAGDHAPITEVADSGDTPIRNDMQPRPSKNAGGIRPGAPTDAGLRRGRTGEDGMKEGRVKKPARGAAAPDKVYRTGVITESTGKKTTF